MTVTLESSAVAGSSVRRASGPNRRLANLEKDEGSSTSPGVTSTRGRRLSFRIEQLELPIVQAPMAGGPSTPALAAAVAEAGGLGFVAAGYRTPKDVRGELEELRSLTSRPFGLNLFVPSSPAADREPIERFARQLESEARRYGAELGDARYDDDGWEEKLALARELRPAVVSFTFGCPSRDLISGLREIGVAVWVTVTTPREAALAQDAGAEVLVVQGFEAGGHRATFDDGQPGDIGLSALLQLLSAELDLPLVASGGVVTGRGVAAVLAAGASAAQLGTALMLTPEAATSPAHRQALRRGGRTAVTRAFSGRSARGIENRFMREHERAAPRAYPEVHYLTSPLRAAARKAGDPEGINLWAGQAYPLAREAPAGELVRQIAAEATQALQEAARRAGV